MHPRPALRQLVLVALLALVSLGALVATPPPLTSAIWSRGDDLLRGAAWLVALAASAWLFVATGACVVALRCARPHLALRLAPALPAGLRRLVEIAIVASCVALPALPAHAAGPRRAAPTVVVDQPVVRGTTAPTIVVAVPVPRSGPAPATPAAPPEHVPPNMPTRIVVHSGDSLWLIARAALVQSSGRSPSATELVRYWREVIAANRSTLRSGNPSLIFPGELVTMPVPVPLS